jgi:hypothetical protein
MLPAGSAILSRLKPADLQLRGAVLVGVGDELE